MTLNPETWGWCGCSLGMEPGLLELHLKKKKKKKKKDLSCHYSFFFSLSGEFHNNFLFKSCKLSLAGWGLA